MMDEDRPDPERLLARIQKAESPRTQGKRRVFLGAAAGVGKTYAMLEQARLRRAQGIDVVVGWVETHGRPETEALLEGLEILPAKSYDYRGTTLEEFDLDAALARRPEILLLDELAHSNAPGSRHAKRWQDAEELLAAGIDVYTTVNIQHLENLNDIVTQTTGVVVRETVPDRILDEADEIELIDITPEDLLERLREGKVYVPAQAERAMRGFFTRGNLIALRELALRRAAERVDAELRTYKVDQDIGQVWPVTERLLVCVSASPTAARVVRGAARMAAGLRAEWIVAYVERPGDPRESDEDRQRISQTFRLAEQLGAQTVTLSGLNVSEELLAHARTQNVTKIVVGKPARARWRYRLFGSAVDELIRGSDDIDVYVIRGEKEEGRSSFVPRLRRRSPFRSYVWGILAVGVATGICLLMLHRLAPANLIMVYLLEVVFVAAVWGRGPSLLATLLSVATFDFFFVSPRLSFAVGDSEYFVTFGVMLIVTLLISTLAVRLRDQAETHRRRQERAAALYRMSREFAQTRTIAEAVTSVERHWGEIFEGEVWVLLPNAEGRLEQAAGITSSFPLDPKERAVAAWVHEHGQMAGLGSATLSGSKAMSIPLKTARGGVGVICLFPEGGRRSITPEKLDLLDAYANQTAVMIERALLVKEAHEAKLRVEAERLRTLLLSSVSHDLRTPLATITGAASSLLESEGLLGAETRRELIQSVLDEAERLNRLLGNLLSMTRIESGGVQLQKEWQPLEEVIGAALNHVEKILRGRRVSVAIPDDLPLVLIDGALMEQVLVNLLENAIKYTPEETAIEITARFEKGQVVVEVADRGPGLPAEEVERIFEKFYRGPDAGARGGVGLGLSICRGIIEAHGGEIRAANRENGGAAFRFTISAGGAPPSLAGMDTEP
jgi:two-component system, OmpR family, sensor histidine kinase KdpD